MNRLNAFFNQLGDNPLVAFLNKYTKWIFSLRFQFIIPYVLVTLVVFLGGIFFVTRLVVSSLNNQFEGQMVEASRVAADVMVGYEAVHLENLRQMLFTEGVTEAVAEEDYAALETLLFPIAANEDIHLITITDRSGLETYSLVQDPASGQFVTSAGSDLSGYEFIHKPLISYVDQLGDKFSAIEELIYGPFLVTSAPIVTAEGELLGVMITGTRLDMLSQEIKSTILADFSLFALSGEALATTFFLVEQNLSDLNLSARDVERTDLTYDQNMQISGREYKVVYSPLMLRQEKVGVYAVALPTSTITSTGQSTRNTFVLVFVLASAAIMAAGLLLGFTVRRPIVRLRKMADETAQGEPPKKPLILRNDEIGDLARSMSQMVDNLSDQNSVLVQSEKLAAISMFASALNQDVRKPLAQIKDLAEDIQSMTDYNQEIGGYLSLIQENVSTANSALTDLMQFAGQAELELAYGNICDTAREVLRINSFLAQKNQVSYDFVSSDDPIEIAYDQKQIEKVLVNLTKNAIEAMPYGGELLVEVNYDDRWVYIDVSDTGDGISEDNLGRIFDPFFTTKDEGQATGLGLSVSYGIVKQHQGEIQLKSIYGSGSKFSVLLPV